MPSHLRGYENRKADISTYWNIEDVQKGISSMQNERCVISKLTGNKTVLTISVLWLRIEWNIGSVSFFTFKQITNKAFSLVINFMIWVFLKF